MSRPVVALLTDFGTRDHYVGTMKGVVLGICPDAALVDISHDVAPQDVAAGALELGACYRYFPTGTVFLIVIDPGVGSTRRALAVEAGAYRFVAPDNGVLSAVLKDLTPTTVVEITRAEYVRPVISRTFEGRDRFAPAAAWLACGVAVSALGPAVETLSRLQLPQPLSRGDGIDGEVVRVDRFGNLVTNIPRPLVDALSAGAGVEIRVGPRRIGRMVATYADAGPGEICAVFGSTDHLEVAASGASAAEALGLGRGAPVHVSRGA
jgi:S-adenosylmethionine hydrolase